MSDAMDLSKHLESYKQHRWRVLNAKSRINSQPPKIPHRLPKMPDYQELMDAIRHGGRQSTNDPFNSRESNEPWEIALRSSERVAAITALKNHLSKPTLSSREIRSINQRVENIARRHKSMVDCAGRNLVPSQSYVYTIPDQVWQRYSYLSCDSKMLQRLLRPVVYFDLEFKGLRPLGRLTIQLFTEACPEVVLQFVRSCSACLIERFNFTRLVPPMWLEGEIGLDDADTLSAKHIIHDATTLDNGSGPGILSFPIRYLRGSKRSFLTFSMSFKPLDVLNGKRIAFGKVRRGFWILDAIQDEPNRNGKPYYDIVVTKCGVVN